MKRVILLVILLVSLMWYSHTATDCQAQPQPAGSFTHAGRWYTFQAAR